MKRGVRSSRWRRVPIFSLLLLLASVPWLPACRREKEAPLRLVVLAPLLPERIDPGEDFRLVSRTVFVNVFDPLVRVGPRGELVPALAASWTNPDPDVWSFRLSSGVRFHDGTRLTAQDVVSSVQRSRQQGSKEAGSLSDLEELSAPDDLTVELRTRGGSGNFLQALTGVLVSKLGEGGQAVGTGPFRVGAFEPGRRVQLERFEAYHARAPVLARVVFERFSAVGPEGAEQLRKEPHAIVLDPTPEMVALARADERFTVESQPSGALRYVAFGLEGPVTALRDARVRRAVQLALAPDRLAAGDLGGGIVATQVIPPGIFGFDPSRRPVTRDVGAARGLLRDAGFGSGVSFRLDVSEGDKGAGEEIASQLSEAGFRVEVRSWPSAEFGRVIEGQSEAYLYSWFVGQEAGEAMKNFFHTKDVSKGLGLRNRTGYSSPRLDGIIESSIRTENPRDRLDLFRTAIGILADELPWVPLYARNSVVIHPRGWKVPARTDGILVLSEVSPGPARP